MPVTIRDFLPSDAPMVDALALRAFEQYRGHYQDWQAIARGVGNMSALADAGELIVAERRQVLVGAVAYIGPGKPKSAIFQPEWPIMRLLVVDPHSRGLGIGRQLAQQCVERANRDSAAVIALHTTSIMEVALPLYVRMGFRFAYVAPAILGVPYGVYVKQLR